MNGLSVKRNVSKMSLQIVHFDEQLKWGDKFRYVRYDRNCNIYNTKMCMIVNYTTEHMYR